MHSVNYFHSSEKTVCTIRIKVNYAFMCNLHCICENVHVILCCLQPWSITTKKLGPDQSIKENYRFQLQIYQTMVLFSFSL